MTDQTELRQLREKRKCLPSVLTYFRDGVYAGELVDCETGNVVDLDHEQMEAFAAMANACDAGLLDVAERGMEAEANNFAVAQMLAAKNQELTTLTAERDEAMRELDPPVCRLQFPDGSVPANAREAAEGWKRWCDAAVAERDRLRGLLLNAYQTDAAYAEMETAFVSCDNVVIPGMAEAAKLRLEAEGALWIEGQKLAAAARRLAATNQKAKVHDE